MIGSVRFVAHSPTVDKLEYLCYFRRSSRPFYGLRQGRLRDPFGHVWSVTTPLEDVTPAEMQRRLDAMMKSENAG
jgi:hypothetical protein